MSKIDIIVKNSGWIPRFRIHEAARGTLFSVDDSQTPFPIRRVYTISQVEESSIERGTHAHKAADQVLFVVQGSVTLHLDDGSTTQTLLLTDADDGVRLGPLVWHSLKDFSSGTVLLVVASQAYDEADYIRAYEDFKTYVNSI